MRYRPETTKKHATSSKTFGQAFVWFISFPGYLIFISSWVGVLVGLSMWFLPFWHSDVAQNQMAPALVAPTSQNTLLLMPSSLIWLFGIASVGALLFFYWLVITFAKQIIHTLADHIDKPVIVVKLLGLTIGCIASTAALSTAQNDLGSLPLVLGATALGVGILSFALEHVLSKYVFQI